MWKSILGISLLLCASATPDESKAKPSVEVKCCGRLRTGGVAIGGETTGTTIKFNRTIWELQFSDDAARSFASDHHKKQVFVTGTLRKVEGVETKARWIVDVKTIKECDATKTKEGAGIKLHGLLQVAKPGSGGASGMSVVTDNQTWPIDFSAVPTLQMKTDALTGKRILLSGILKQDTKNEANSRTLTISVRTLEKSER